MQSRNRREISHSALGKRWFPAGEAELCLSHMIANIHICVSWFRCGKCMCFARNETHLVSYIKLRLLGQVNENNKSRF